LNESENEPLRIDETGEDRSLEPGLRPAELEIYGEPLETCPGVEIPYTG